MTDINRTCLIGRLTADPTLKATQGGTSVASFTLASNRSYTQQGAKKEEVSFFNCVAWAKTGEVIAQYAKKGQRLAIEGRLQQRSYEKDGQKRSVVEVIVDNFQFIDGKSKEQDVVQKLEDAGLNGRVANDFSDADVPTPF